MPRPRKKPVEETVIETQAPIEAAPIAEKPKPAPNPTVQAALSQAKDVKSKDEVINPPKWTDKTGRNYEGVDMAAEFNTKRLRNFDFRNANLDGADFTGMTVQGCKFAGASLNGTIFVETDLRWSDFTGADYNSALFGVVNEDGIVTRKADTREVDGMTR